MLEARNLVKTYGPRTVVSDVSLIVRAGEIVGLLGPNGAGKTTTVSMVCGLVTPTRGQVFIDGADMAQHAARLKRRIGLVPQELSLYEDLPARTNLALFGALYGLSGPPLARRVAQALELVGLADRARDKPATFSGGMKRRLNIACGLVHDPDVLLFDEPTVGMDPQSRNAIFDNLETLKAAGKAIVYTTHYMEEAERLADRIVIIDHGRVVASDTLAGLHRLVPATHTLEIEVDGLVDTALLARETGVRRAAQTGATLAIGADDLTRAAAAVLPWLAGRGHAVRHVTSGRATLEDVFLGLTGRQLRD
jgi:ABC-2 type transport system ATP-binding protein